MASALAGGAGIGRLRINRIHVVGLGAQKTVFFQFYLLDRPPHPTAKHETSLDQAMLNLETIINQGDFQIDMSAYTGFSSRYTGTDIRIQREHTTAARFFDLFVLQTNVND